MSGVRIPLPPDLRWSASESDGLPRRSKTKAGHVSERSNSGRSRLRLGRPRGALTFIRSQMLRLTPHASTVTLGPSLFLNENLAPQNMRPFTYVYILVSKVDIA